MKIVTFNIRCSWDGDGINSFIHRAGMIYDKIRAARPDIIAFQEIKPAQADFLRRIIGDIYDIEVFYRSENYDGEGLMIALLRESFAFEGLEYFWLSPTPHVPGSRFPIQSKCPRIAVIALCRELESGKIIRVCNTHLDHQSDEARLLGMRQLLSRIEQLQNEYPLETVILGDMNAEPGSSPMNACRDSSLGLTDLTDNLSVTYHGFFAKPATKIDYVFATKNLAAAADEAQIWDEEHAGIYISDHYPVEIFFNLK